MMNSSYTGNLSFPALTGGRYYLVLFILWPFLAFMTALYNFATKEGKIVVYLFLIYYGLTFTVGSIGADAEYYAHQLAYYSQLPFSDFSKVVAGLYTDTSVDILEPFISFMVSRITSHHALYFAFWAALFGFFYLKSINLLYEKYRENPGMNAYVFFVFFIVILPITNINSVRMWTAAWIFFYGAYHVVLYRKPKYLLLTLSACLVHFSFLTANVIVIIYYFAKNRNLIYFPLAVISFFIPNLFMPVFRYIASLLGGTLETRFEIYTSEILLRERQMLHEQSNWFIKIGDNLVLFFLLLCMLVIQLRFRDVMRDKTERNLFSFSLLFLAFVNFGKGIPSFGGRFELLFFLFATLYIFLFFMKLPHEKLSTLTIIGLFPMLLYAAIAFRIGSDSISAWLFTPGLGVPFFVKGLSIADLLFY